MYLVTSWPEVQTCNPFLDGLLQIKSQEPSCQFTSTDPNFFLKKDGISSDEIIHNLFF